MGDDTHLRETPVARAELMRGHFLHVVRDTVRLPSGREATREYVLHPGAVMVIGLLDDGRVVLERQYRHPMRSVLIEFPAGKRDPGEDSLACAQREFQEETGYVAREWAFAGRLAPTVAYSDECIDIWFARGLEPGERRLDEGEFLEVILGTADELLESCRLGEIIDSKTLIGALWLQNVRSGAWVLEWVDATGRPLSR
ncbi:MAG TPA: NUDIX hydrolase [Hydrogenophaga sp.]|uniref:NUDIX hydrolase n=1 Tax=Hydrogenophaga sp. TaxID=1904254 RepID=UPI002C9B5687|nr:NUDIX hydrolase [Hydrogenophaga sp.]HMN93766.1 NUDIX hydrolase [Hydrogenophaga sp.]HMP09934.1 NUDIX hydrolase [Hydrogenophaga sp.]